MSLWPDWLRRADDSAEPPSRWVVLDVETTGLDVRRDHLLAVAALAVQAHDSGGLQLCLSDHFEVTVRPAALSSRDNVLIHGIGLAAQQVGMAGPKALAQLSDFLADSPVLGFHVAFDRAVLTKAWQDAGLPVPVSHWLDVADLCRLAWPEQGNRSLDDWLAGSGITCLRRHNAAADTLATAELMAAAWPRLRRKVGTRWRELTRAATAARWLGQG